MARKAGGLAAIMSGQPVVVVKKRSVFWRLRHLTRQGGLHVGLILVCILYVYVGALFFLNFESPEEERVHRRVSRKFDSLMKEFVKNVEVVRQEDVADRAKVNESVSRLLDDYSKHMLKLFTNPVAANMFDCLFYFKSNYTPLWTTDSSLLFTATTIIPVGYGYIAPLTSMGRIVLCVYAGFGIPLALVMMSDVGKFFADVFVKFFNENITAFMVVLIFLLVAYLILGGIAISKTVEMPMVEGIYFSTITIFTIGYGDISPDLPVYIVIVFIVFGVALVTVAIDVVAANIIHHIHYMGRQVGKARIIADKMLSMAQKININRGLGLGMAQLGAFARMGMMINVSAMGTTGDGQPNGAVTEGAEGIELSRKSTWKSREGEEATRKSTAFEPNLDFDMIDYRQPAGSSQYLYGFGFDNDAFRPADTQSDDDSVFM